MTRVHDRRWPGGRAAVVALVLARAATARAQPSPGWELRVPERVAIGAGATAPVVAAIAVDRGLSVSRDAPVIVDLVPEPGASVKRRRLGRADAVDPDADAPRFSIAVRGDAPGDHALRLRVRFWLCAARSCVPVDARATAVIAVGPPP